MTLSNAILQLLKREKTPLSIHEITSILNEKKEHQKKDRSPISDEEVRFVTGRLGLLFNISGNLVDLHPNEKISGTYTMEWIDHARIRPSMYLGSEKNDAIALIFCSIAQTAIEFTGSTDLFVKIVVKKIIFLICHLSQIQHFMNLSLAFSQENLRKNFTPHPC